ncbi:MAG: hypothetical protein ACRDJJ_06060 [Actinomycetota bacterium]
MRIPAVFKATALAVAVVAGWSLPAAASSYRTWTEAREGPQRDAAVQGPLFTAAREAQAAPEKEPLISFFTEARESAPGISGFEYPTLAHVREAAPASQPEQALSWASVREGYDPAPAVATSTVEESSSDRNDEIIIGSALVAAFLLGAGLGLVLFRRRVPSVA